MKTPLIIKRTSYLKILAGASRFDFGDLMHDIKVESMKPGAASFADLVNCMITLFEDAILKQLDDLSTQH